VEYKDELTPIGEVYDVSELKEELKKRLNEAEYKIIFLYFGIGGIKANQEEIGNYLGISQVAVSKKLKRICEKLKKNDLFELLIESIRGIDNND
jgi:DNA-directed RNA polymerase specialized sigma subunit